MIRLLAMVLAFAPFAFGMIRALQTDGTDMRYLWVAFAAFTGAMARMALARRARGRLMTRRALAAGVFFVSTAFAAIAAWMLGTMLGPALFIVAAGFGFCYAASTYLQVRA